MKTCINCSKKHKSTYKDLCDYCYRQRPQYKSYTKKYNQKRRSDPKQRFNISKSKAKQRDLCWNINLDQFTDLINKPCYYCGISLINFTNSSLDRINNDLGYLVDNVLPCCGDCNKIRQDKLTVDEMKVAMEAILNYRNSKR